MDIAIPPRLKEKKILVADDQSSIRETLKLVLKEAGFKKVIGVSDGAEALKVMREQAIDLVICDWQMPKFSGLDVLRQVRSCDATLSLPFMMFTSSSESESVTEALNAGVSDYVVKPFQPAHLCRKTIRLLAKSQHVPAILTIDVGISSNEPDSPMDIESADTDKTPEAPAAE